MIYMDFSEYWATRPSLDYEEMLEAKRAFDFQASRMRPWRDARKELPDAETQVIAVRLATDEQISIDKEYCPVIFAAIDPDREGVWYDWESGNDIDIRYFNIVRWMPLSAIYSEMGE